MNILILGAGQVGSNVAYQLAREEANQVTIVDIDPGSLRDMATNPAARTADAIDPWYRWRQLIWII